MKKLISKILVIVMVLTLLAPNQALKSHKPYLTDQMDAIIAKWMEHGVIHGFSSGEYLPEESMTRAQLVQLLNNLTGLVYDGENAFSDIHNGDWYQAAISKAYGAGIIKGYPDGSFKSNNNITRQDAIVMIYQALEFTTTTEMLNEVESILKDWNDVSVYAMNAVAYFAVNGDIQHFRDNLKPKKTITRGEVLQIVDHTISLYCNEDGPTVSNMTVRNGVVAAENLTLKKVTIQLKLWNHSSIE